MPDAVL